MKIKKFKQEVRTENFDIPNVLEKIKPIAYSRKFPLGETVKPTFKWKPFAVTFATIIFALGVFFSFSSNLKEGEMEAPENADFSGDGQNYFDNDKTPTNIEPENKGLTRETYYEGLYDKAISKENTESDITSDFALTEEQKDTYVSSDVYFAFYDIVINQNTKEYNSAYQQLTLWGENNGYDEKYFIEHENEIYYIFDMLTE